MFFFFFLLSTPASSTPALPAPAAGQFRAAVLEHQLLLPSPCLNTICSRDRAVTLMEENLWVMEQQVVEAARLGAEIILMPEDGIHGYGHASRDILRPFLEFVPPEADGSNPCYEDNGEDDGYVQTRLSCLAAENQIYIGATLGSVLPGCQYCQHGGECFYNTFVLYNNTGHLVGVYHKYNLWTSELTTFDIDLAPSLVTVDTEFGRLGLAVCADLMWNSPIVELVVERNISSLLLPLSWWDLFPHQLAHSNQAAWARGLQVNLLAANTHEAASWSSGSGLYSSTGHLAYYHDISPGSGGKLILADLDISPSKTERDWAEYATEHQDSIEESDNTFQEVVYGDTYTFVALRAGQTSAKVCQETFCCLAEYSLEQSSEVFSLGVFRGDHYRDGSVSGHWRMEMCSVIKCDPANPAATCRQDQSWDYDFLSSSDTVFTSLAIAATFTPGAGVYPEVLFDGVTLRPELVNISQAGVLSLVPPADVPLVSMSLFGRVYQEDPDLPDHYCPAQY